ncbi:MAG: helix-turn-helix transcriptional regulator [Ruthenibacterium sp.]
MPIKCRISPFGMEIKKALLDKNMTQIELSAQVGTSPEYLGLILAGHRSGTKYRQAIVDTLKLDKKWSADSAAS